ncbi:glycosyltransferase [Nocardia stercoris]|uniref:Glycosyltransferase n=1 Tax=Nocardia stercoris TaxID=2483361 RepID=A0A3M2LCE8_9NOCA|nr:glycosyltransferase [Nocardia stercoris]RMI35207.1 glycosyltransferase [Nocardia stercoris]
MRILLAFAGSRGDAQPGVLLARELLGRGHDPVLAVSPNLVEFATSHGVSAVGYGWDSDELLRTEHNDRRFSSANPARRIQAMLDLQRRGFAEAATDLLGLAPDADLIVTGMAFEEVADGVAGRRGIPMASMHFCPVVPNRAISVIPTRWANSLPGWVNKVAMSGGHKARAWALSDEVGRLQGGVEPKPVSRTYIQAYDADMFPGLRRELGPNYPVTGFPVVPEGTPVPDPALKDWLDAGTAPVYAGFGSMLVADPVYVAGLLRDACLRRGRRLLLVGSAFTPEFGPEVAVVPRVDHGSVLPRCAAAVHHGGAGTTAAVLRAGIPSVICSVQADQPFWGLQMERLGLGSTAPLRRLTRRKLDRLLDRALDPEVARRSAVYAAGFDDKGIAHAADIVESLVPATISGPTQGRLR